MPALPLVGGHINLPKHRALVHAARLECIIAAPPIGPRAPREDRTEGRRREQRERAGRRVHERVACVEEEPACVRGVRGAVQDYGRGTQPGGAV